MIEIAAAILKRTSAESLSISKIILFENLSYKEAKKCLDQLLRTELIKLVQDGNSKRYITTSKGLAFVSSLRKVIDTYAGGDIEFSSRK